VQLRSASGSQDPKGRATRALLRAYILNQTTHWFIAGILTPVLVLLIIDKGLSIAEAGAALAFYSATTIVMELPTGGLADGIGRKRVYMISLGVSFCGLLVLLLSQDFIAVGAAMALSGAGRALSSGSVDAWFVDEFNRLEPGGNLQRALAKASVFAPLGLGAGALLGGTLPMAFAPLASEVGISAYSVDIIAMLVAILVQAVATQRIIAEPRSPVSGSGWTKGVGNVPAQLRRAARNAAGDRTVAVLLLVGVCLGFGLVGLELLWQPRLSQLLGGAEETWAFGALAAGYFAATAFGSLIAMPYCRSLRDDHPSALLLGHLGLGAMIFVLALQTSAAAFAVLYLLTYMMIGLVGSPFDALYNRHVRPNDRSTMLSLLSLTIQVGGLVGNVVIGYVAGIASIPAAWSIASAVILLSSLGFLYLVLRARRTSHAPRGTAYDGKSDFSARRVVGYDGGEESRSVDPGPGPDASTDGGAPAGPR
jgi:DHA1 family quinolone resistance protein-like MFS transporter